MTSLARIDSGSLITCLVVAVMLVAGVFVLALCSDGLCSSCAHEYYGSSDRSKHLVVHFARRMTGALMTLITRPGPAHQAAIGASWAAPLAGAPDEPLLRVATLRI